MSSFHDGPNRNFAMNDSSNSCQNRVIKIVPNVLKITFPAFGKKTFSNVVKVLNMLDKPQYVSIFPPQTKYFHIENAPKGSLRVDVSLDILVVFDPKEVRHYHDLLQLHCCGTHFQIPLHAQPQFENLKIPSSIKFGDVSIGNMKEFKLCIPCLPLNQDIIFCITSPDSLSNFTVSPTQGIMSSVSKSPCIINVSYTATDMAAAKANLKLFLPTLCPTSFYISLTANTNQDKKNGKSLEDNKDSLHQSHHIPLHSSIYQLTDSLEEIRYKIALQEFFIKVQESCAAHEKGKVKLEDVLGMRMNDVFNSMVPQLKPKDSYLQQNAVLKSGGIPSNERIMNFYDKNCEINLKKLGHICSDEATWFLRFQSLTKFMNAGNRIIIHNRMKKRLSMLKKLSAADLHDTED